MSKPWTGTEYLAADLPGKYPIRRYYNPLLMRNRWQFGDNPEASLLLTDQEIDVNGLNWFADTIKDWIDRCVDYQESGQSCTNRPNSTDST